MSRRSKHHEPKIPQRTRKFRPVDEAPKAYRPRLLDLPPAPYRVFIAMPTRDTVPAEFMYAYGQMIGLLSSTLVADGIIELSANMVQSTAIHVGRQDLAEQALMRDATHILWLDTDHEFPPETFVKVFRHVEKMIEEKYIVGLNYSTRKFPPKAVTFKHLRKRWARTGEDCNVTLYTLPESTGLEEADAIGFGFVFMPVEVLRDIGVDKQYFMFEHNPDDLREWSGEDVYFCRVAREAGWKVFVDHDASQDLGHIGQFKFMNPHAVFMTNEEMKKNGTGELLRPASGDFDMDRAQRLDGSGAGSDSAGGGEAEPGLSLAEARRAITGDGS